MMFPAASIVVSSFAARISEIAYFAALPIGFAVGEAGDAALRILTELSQRVEVLDDAGAIDAELGLKRERTKGKRARRAQKSKTELATVHAGLTKFYRRFRARNSFFSRVQVRCPWL